ncbi:hypothetical protein GOD54_23570 [Sinorhizobium medicae]|nr:hypothetical protein [Sinorhizobium medicae]
MKGQTENTSAMMTMPRELAHLLFRSLNGGDNQLTGMEHGAAFRELKALLATEQSAVDADFKLTGEYHTDVQALMIEVIQLRLSAVPDTRAVGGDVPTLAAEQPVAPRPELTVWYGSMHESNGKSNFTAILHRKGQCISEGVCIDRSEYPERTRYEADRMRHLIGELAYQPDILAYDADAHSGYVSPLQRATPVYLYRRNGLEDWVTCTHSRFVELSSHRLFQTRTLYDHG